MIANLCGQCGVAVSYDGNRYIFRISAKGETSPVNVIFSGENLDDFEEVLKANDNSSYGRAFRNFVHFRLYVAIGKAGLIPSFGVSQEFLKEERDWWTTQHAPILKWSRTLREVYVRAGISIGPGFFASNSLINRLDFQSTDCILKACTGTSNPCCLLA